MDGQQPSHSQISTLPFQTVKVQKLIDRDIQKDEEEEKEIHFIKQFVSEVLDFSSQYGSEASISYTAFNLTGKPSKYPDYGDFAETFLMKTYGNWWKEAPSYSREYMPQNTPKIASSDYVDVEFEQEVFPYTISIYETYNPGSVVRIWAYNDYSCKKRWALLWEGEPTNAGPISRIFSPPIKTIDFRTSVLRIEFNHSKCNYYTGIDAILLVGTELPIGPNVSDADKLLARNLDGLGDISVATNVGKLTQQVMKLKLHIIPTAKTDLQAIVSEFNKNRNSFENGKCAGNSNGSFNCLPNETILKILSYLDLESLRCCAQLNRHFLFLCNDSFLYTKLSLRPYWSKITDQSLVSLTMKSQNLHRLDLSWCGNYNMITKQVFEKFVSLCCRNLTCIRLNCCRFVTDSVMKVISETSSQLKEVALRNCSAVTEAGFFHLSSFASLERVDLYRTNITSASLIEILKANRNILHLNIGGCVKILNLDEIAITLAAFSKNLVSLDFWKMSNLTQFGVTALSQCTLLEEVDFGWCLGLELPVDSLAALASGCPRLKKLFLTSSRRVADKDLEPFIKHCPDLEQIDLSGILGITCDICLRLLSGLPKLKLLDLSFCDTITDAQVVSWRGAFPSVAIKRSFNTEMG